MVKPGISGRGKSLLFFLFCFFFYLTIPVAAKVSCGLSVADELGVKNGSRKCLYGHGLMKKRVSPVGRRLVFQWCAVQSYLSIMNFAVQCLKN